MGITIATVRTAVNTSTGNQDFTTGDLGGLTPKAAFLVMSFATSDGVSAPDYNIGIGACDASNEWCYTANDEDGQGTTDCTREGYTVCMALNTPGTGGAICRGTFVSFIANGIRINWTIAPPSAYLLTITFFAGSDLSAHVNNFTTTGVLNNTQTITGVGFEANCLLTATTRGNGGTLRLSSGVVDNDGLDTQHSWGHRSENGDATSAISAILSTSYGLSNLDDAGALNWAIEFDNFGADGFDAIDRIGDVAAISCGFLALEFNSVVDTWLGVIDTPTSTGNDSQTGSGLTPQAVIQGMTLLTAIDSVATNASAGGVGISVFDASVEYSIAVNNEDNVGTTNTQSLSDNTAINLPQDDGTAGLVASYVSMDSIGYTLNYTTVLGSSVKFWVLVIGTVTSGSIPVIYHHNQNQGIT